jgi:hypothetical protein
MGQLDIANTLATDARFLGVVRAAVMKVAIDILNEPASTPLHDARIALVRSVFAEVNQENPRFVGAFVWLCAADPAIRAAGIVGGLPKAEVIPDVEPIRVVAANWNVVAGES